MTIALPDYISARRGLDQSPPGHRFGLYFDGWDGGWQTPTNKTPAFLKLTSPLPRHCCDALEALRQRQTHTAQALGDLALSLPVQLSAPLSTGLGNEHPLENGFAFLNPYGLPYLAGSGAKGVLRRAAEELASGEWGDSTGWNQDAIDILFGPGEERLDQGVDFRRGALAFWDVFFVPGKDGRLLKVEIMTPHHSGYLQGSGSPHANEDPNPVPFLAISAGARATLHIACTPALIPANQTVLHDGWRQLVEAAVTHAGEWLGFGAKSAVGYGRVGIDTRERETLQEEAATAARQAELGELSAAGRALREFVDACTAKAAKGHRDKLNTGLHQTAAGLVANALKADSDWSVGEKANLAETLEIWLPKVVDKLDRKDDWKDARKKLKLAQLAAATPKQA